MDSVSSAKQYMPDAATVAAINGYIDEYNAKRPAVRQSSVLRTWLCLCPYVLVVAPLLYVTWSVDKRHIVFLFTLSAACFGGAGLLQLAREPATRHREMLRELLLPRLFSFIGDFRSGRGDRASLLKEVVALKLVQFTASASDDFISGTHQGLKFEMLETRLTYGSGRSKEVVFDGLIFRFRLDNPFPGRLVAVKRKWLTEMWKEMWRTGPNDDLPSGNHRLDETHVFRSDNHAAARPIIAGPLTSLLIGLRDEWRTDDVRIALSGDYGYLMLPAEGNYFALPSIDEDVRYQRHIEPLVEEMAMLLSVAHRLKGLG